MSFPKFPNISLNDIERRPLVVIIALLLLLCGFLFVQLNKDSTRELEAMTKRANECDERYERIVTQMLIQADIIQDYEEAIDTAKNKSEKVLNDILK